MKLITILLAAFVLISLGFTIIERKVNEPDQEQLKQEFEESTSAVSPYQQSRKDITTWD